MYVFRYYVYGKVRKESTTKFEKEKIREKSKKQHNEKFTTKQNGKKSSLRNHIYVNVMYSSRVYRIQW